MKIVSQLFSAFVPFSQKVSLFAEILCKVQVCELQNHHRSTNTIRALLALAKNEEKQMTL